MFEFFIEYDINPVIFFDSRGNVKYCNQEAEMFLSYVNVKDIFNFTLQNAPKDKGIITVFKEIKFNDFSFKGFSIGYQSDELIGIRFFINTEKNHISIENLEKTDILKLLNFAIEYITLKQKTKFKIYPDLSFSDVYINKKELLHIFLEIFEKQSSVEIYTHLKVGEYLKINKKKYPIIEIIIKCHPNKKITSKYFEVTTQNDKYIIKIPFIKEKNENNNT